MCYLCKKNLEAYLFAFSVLIWLSGAWCFKEFNSITSSWVWCFFGGGISYWLVRLVLFICGSRSYPVHIFLMKPTPFFSISPFNVWTCLSLHHLTHTSWTHSYHKKFPLPVISCLASIYSQSYYWNCYFQGTEETESKLQLLASTYF